MKVNNCPHFRSHRIDQLLSPQFSKLFHSSHSFKYFISCALLLLILTTACSVYAQIPGIQWQRTDWYPKHPVNGNQTQGQSGEDWWYDHKNSYSNGNLNGYICAGFSGFVNFTLSEKDYGGCLQTKLGEEQCYDFETTGNVRGSNLATVALMKPDGSGWDWFNTYNEGWFLRVIQTSDGGYLAVGVTVSTRQPNGAPLFYNPNQAAGEVTDYFSEGTACVLGDYKRHVILVKTNANGQVQWQYLYGMLPYRDAFGNPNSLKAYQTQADGWDVIETTSGNFRIVGNAEDFNYGYICNSKVNTLSRALMIEVGPNGYWLWGKFYGSPSYPSNFAAIAKYSVSGNPRYVVAGTEHFMGGMFNGYTGCQLYQKGSLMQFDSSPMPNTQWVINNFDVDLNASQSVHDVQISTNINVQTNTNDIFLPIITHCKHCLYAGFNQGEAKVYRINSNGAVIGPLMGTSLGKVTAYDLKLRVSPTPDGGFGAVSSKQTTNPPPPYDCAGTYQGPVTVDTSYWATDAYVAKVGACGVIEWETTFDVDNLPAATAYPGNVKKQECMYSISRSSDGGFVISGNNSYNFDDNYLVKLFPVPPINASLHIRDTVQDIGLEANPDNGPMWISEDIWVLKKQDPNYTPNPFPISSPPWVPPAHENPEYRDPSLGVHNYIYVRVKNKGCQPASGELKVYWAKASTGLSWPSQWVNYNVNSIKYGDKIPATPISINQLAPGNETIVEIPWDPPNPADFASFGADQGHFCLLTRIETSSAATYGMTYPEWTDVYSNARNNNKIAWKNVTVVDEQEGSGKTQAFIVRNVPGRNLPPNGKASLLRLSFDIPKEELNDSLLKYATIRIDLGAPLFRKWVAGGKIGSGAKVVEGNLISIESMNSWIGNIRLTPK